MTGSTRVTDYLDSQQIRYELYPHRYSKSSVASAISAEVPIHQVAKAVMLEDHEGRYLMAIVPADYKISLSQMNEEFHRTFKLAKESQIYQMFDDCDRGAVPPVPDAYHTDAVYDDALHEVKTIYIESGDHETLIAMDRDDFEQLMANYAHARFSNKTIH